MNRTKDSFSQESVSRMTTHHEKSDLKNRCPASSRHVPIQKSGFDFQKNSFMSPDWESFDKACRRMEEDSRSYWDDVNRDDRLCKSTKRYSPQLLETVTKKSETKKNFFREETTFSSSNTLKNENEDFLPLDDKNFMTTIRDNSKVFELTVDARNFNKGTNILLLSF